MTTVREEREAPPSAAADSGGGGGVMTAVEDLCGLSAALSEFLREWNAMHDALHSINASIDAAHNKSTASQGDDGGGGSAPSLAEKPELDFICESMGARALRKYISTHLADPASLRAAVPAALRLAPNPSRLVLDAIGRFYLQGSKAYVNDSRAVPTRDASLLLLELFLLSGCLDSSPDPSVAEEARVAALAWRSRLVGEGGVHSAGPADALGLVLFLAAFGFPQEVTSKDLYDLLRRVGNLKEKAEVLRRAHILMNKMPDIIKDMISKERHVEAVELISAFGLEKKFPLIPLLSSFLNKCVQPSKDQGRGAQYSNRSEEMANRKQLAMLKSVIKCMEDNKLDLSKLASFKIDEKIAMLETAISKGEEKRKGDSLKRKAVEIRPLNKSEAHARYLRSASADASHQTPLQLNRHAQEHGTVALSNVQGYYNGWPPENMHDGGFNGLIERSGTGQVAAAVHGTSALMATGYGGSLTNTGGSYGWYGNEAPTETSARYNLLEMPTSSGQGLTGPPMWNGSMDPSQTAEHNLYHPQTALPHGMGSRNSGSNLYKFADAVQEPELYHVQPVRSTAVYDDPRYHHASHFS